jgi:hypothetical protein
MKKSLVGVVSCLALIGALTLWKPIFAKPQVATPHKTTLSWTASTTPNVTYTVYRSTSAAGPFTAIGSGVITTTFTDTTEVPGTKYFFEVDAVDVANQDSGPSNQTSATEPINPNPPTGLVAVSQ